MNILFVSKHQQLASRLPQMTQPCGDFHPAIANPCSSLYASAINTLLLTMPLRVEPVLDPWGADGAEGQMGEGFP